MTTWRVYAAEESIPLGEPLPTLTAARDLVRQIQRSPWWRGNVQYDVTVEMELAGYDGQDGWINSYSQPHGLGRSATWTISLHPEMLNDLVVLHELAHCIAPRWQYSGNGRRPGELHDHVEHPRHGSGFAGAMAALVSEFASGSHRDELRAAYAHFEVPVMTLTEYQVAVRESLRAEDDVISMGEELIDRTKLCPQPVPPGGWKIPTFGWGERLMVFRHRYGPERRRLGRDRLADLIRPVEPCTGRDIKRIEESLELPTDPRLRRIAMCFAVVMGLDPIYARHQMGLARWDCGVELDELRGLNPEWVELVESMNRQQEQRPPRWVVPGDR